MWIFIWVLLSSVILGVFFWSTAILLEQKKAWKATAKTLALDYDAGGRLTASPTVKGLLDGRRVAFFTDRQQTTDMRGQRFVTAIEIDCGPGAPVAAVFAAPSYRPHVAGMALPQAFTPDIVGWGSDFLCYTTDPAALTAFLTPERKKVLSTLFTMKNTAVFFYCDERLSVLRIETSDPLKDAGRMEKIARRLMALVGPLAAITQATPSKAPPPVEAPPKLAPLPAPADDELPLFKVDTPDMPAKS